MKAVKQGRSPMPETRPAVGTGEKARPFKELSSDDFNQNKVTLLA